MLKQLYHTLIYPYILSYGLVSWGNTYNSRLAKLSIKQNKCIRSMFFARNQNSASPYYDILEMLKLN